MINADQAMALKKGSRIKVGRRSGTVISDGHWGGYVVVDWDSGQTEHGVHIRDISSCQLK